MSGRADWVSEYEARLLDPAGAAELVQAGDALYTPIGGDAETLLRELLPRLIEDPTSFRVRACSPRGAHEWFGEDLAWLEADLSVEVFAGTIGRSALRARRADYVPDLFSTQFNVHDHRGADRQAIDVFASICTPPDAEGYVNFGTLPWNKGDYVRRARTSILEVVPWLPRCRTTERLHVSEVTAFIEDGVTERPLMREEQPPPEALAVAGFVHEIIEDGDTLQIGAGRTASFLAEQGALEGKRDLGWHSEMTPANVLPWMMNGVINGSRKTLDPGLAVTASIYLEDDAAVEEWVASSGLIETRAVREVNAIPAIAGQERMCAINNAFRVDLTGQICSESLGTTVYNGTGGQPEFHIGAVIAPGGKAITVLPSTFGGGAGSRIVPLVDDGTFVTVPRSFADYVVTEFGIARLAGKSQRERADELIAIAHPDHRGELRRARQTQFFPADAALE